MNAYEQVIPNDGAYGNTGHAVFVDGHSVTAT
jgi:hypothetical protein